MEYKLRGLKNYRIVESDINFVRLQIKKENKKWEVYRLFNELKKNKIIQ